MLLITGMDWFLRGMGLAACGGLGSALLRLRKIQGASCDASCAAAKLPADAYRGKVVWITGASSGIGKGLAVEFAKQGAKVILSSRRAKELEEVAQELAPLLKASGGDASILTVDLSDLDSLPGKAAEARRLFQSPVDVLVNNGGYSSRALARDVQGIQEDIKMMEVNLLSWIALAKAVLPERDEKRPVQIINISSLAGKLGVPLRTMYCAAKHAVIGWFDALRAEEMGFWGTDLTVLNVCPGSVKTSVSDNAVTADGSKLGHTDPNIMNGLDVAYVSDRILASAHCGLDEIWIAKWGELRGAYLSQYAPGTFKQKDLSCDELCRLLPRSLRCAVSIPNFEQFSTVTVRDMALVSVGHTMGEVFVKERLASKL